MGLKGLKMSDRWEKYAAPEEKKGKGADRWEKYAERPKVSEGESKLRGAMSGFSLGADDEIAGHLEALGSKVGLRGLGGSFTDTRLESPEEDEKGYWDVYKEARDKRREANQKAQESNPAAYGIYETGGGLVTSWNPIGRLGRLATLAKAKPVASSLQALGRAAEASPVKAAIIGGATGSGLVGFNQSKAENPEDLLSDTLDAAQTGALFGFGGQQVAKYAPKIAASTGKGMAGLYAGVGPKKINEYLGKKNVINSLNEPDVIEELGQKIDDLQTSFGSRKSALDDTVDELKYSGRREADLRESGAKELAKSNEIAAKSQAENLTREASELLSQGLKGLRSEISQGSGEAFDVLERAGEDVPLRFLKGFITKKMNDLKIAGRDPGTPEFSTLAQYRSFLEDIGEDAIPAVEMKKLLMKMDGDIEAAYAAARVPGGYLSKGARELMNMRKFASESVKSRIPEYRDAMRPVSEKTRLMSRMGDEFSSSPDDIYRELKGINDTGRRDRMQTLRDFDSQIGGGIIPKIEEAQGLRSKDFMSEAKPEIARADEMRGERFRDFFKDQYDQLKADKSSVGGLTRGTIQNQLRRYGNKPESYVELGRKFENLAKLQGEDPGTYKDLASNLALKRSFETPYVRGSRNVNLGALSMTGLGKLFGVSLEAIPGMQGLGAIIGGFSDIAGPQTVKRIVDFIDSDQGKSYALIYQDAAKRGPQALAVTHELLMKRDPAYRAAMEEEEQ